MTPVEQAAYNLGFARGSDDEGAYQREITRLRDCWAEALANYAKQNSEVEQLRGTLSLAEEGLASYAQENEELLQEHARFVNEKYEAIAECGRLRAALQKIAAYDPGTFRPLEDEIAIWRLATDALAACSGVPQPGEQT